MFLPCFLQSPIHLAYPNKKRSRLSTIFFDFTVEKIACETRTEVQVQGQGAVVFVGQGVMVGCWASTFVAVAGMRVASAVGKAVADD